MGSKRPRRSYSLPSDSSPPETQFVSQSDDADNLWEVSEILDERGPSKTGDYLIQWKGKDPDTGKPWTPSWTKKKNCTNDLVLEWKAKRANMEVEESKVKEEKSGSKKRQMKEEKSGSKKRKMDHKKKGEPSVTFEVNSRSSRSRTRSTPARSPLKSTNAQITRINSNTSALTALSSELTSLPTTPSRSTENINRPIAAHIPPEEPEDDSAVVSQRKTRSANDKRTVESHTSSDESTAGPGPSTAANRSRRTLRGSSSRRSTGKQIVTAPQKDRHMVVQPSQASVSYGGSGSINQSQLDPIQQFSSPRSSTRTYGKRDRSAASVHADDSGTESDGVRVVLKSHKTIRRDGEEGVRLDGDSSNDDTASAKDGSSEPSIHDEDLDDLDSNAGEGVGGDRPEKADVNQSQSFNDNQSTPVDQPPNAAPAAEPFIHPDTLALEKAQELIAKLQADLEQASRPRSHPDTLALAEAKSRIVELELQLQSHLSQPSHPRHPTPPNSDPRVAELEAEVERLNQNKRALMEDTQFLRKQYAEASNRAVTECQLSEKYQAQIKTLKSQLSVGLKQQRLHSEATQNMREREIDKLRSQLEMLLSQSRRTDDDVRKRAAAYTATKREYEELSRQFVARGREIDSLTKKVNTMSERNEELVDQLKVIRAMKMGVIPDEDEDEDDQETDSSDEYDDPRPKAGTGSRSRRIDSSPHQRDVFQASTPARESTTAPTSGYACAWRDGDRVCRVVCETVEVNL
ncbi:hypothetical protein I203_104281 [Kwoniella mangroviensis CBS 8507]|uniref:uncharacterized protein n=1 Tax=Kwoniella mangroviensis CBS 8507 TaxID=1296122 RepID=UPI00080D2E89|nr:uncharacterized protein I203_00774 [Kwoniella mangroviensis CBS 8507]OCF70639.1 hypothetical protein I203_00774 [Kwoniella mangroviensis CBS 8507]